ncbi:MAG: YqgE/AlgH family protein [Betaproteobacteria bacterium]|nr:YqgE/AlgH family protein [Betaproteobacteria bacterium]
MKRLLGALAAFLVLSCPALVRAQDLSKPMLLVARPSLQGPYSHTALIVVPLGDKHIGFILNRATDTPMASAFPDHAPSKKVVDPIYFGGPEASDALFALVRHDPGEPSLRLFGNLYMTGNAKSIDHIIETTPNEARYFAGFVGWMPEELAAELAKGFWFVGEADASQVFRKDTTSMWEELVERFGKGKPKAPNEREAAAPGLAAAL